MDPWKCPYCTEYISETTFKMAWELFRRIILLFQQFCIASRFMLKATFSPRGIKLEKFTKLYVPFDGI